MKYVFWLLLAILCLSYPTSGMELVHIDEFYTENGQLSKPEHFLISGNYYLFGDVLYNYASKEIIHLHKKIECGPTSCLSLQEAKNAYYYNNNHNLKHLYNPIVNYRQTPSLQTLTGRRIYVNSGYREPRKVIFANGKLLKQPEDGVISEYQDWIDFEIEVIRDLDETYLYSLIYYPGRQPIKIDFHVYKRTINNKERFWVYKGEQSEHRNYLFDLYQEDKLIKIPATGSQNFFTDGKILYTDKCRREFNKFECKIEVYHLPETVKHI